jgi:hypothetical protein
VQTSTFWANDFINLKLLFTSLGYFWEKKTRQRSEGFAPLVAGANANKIGYYCGGWMIA